MRSKAMSGFVIGTARIGFVAVRTESGVKAVPDPVLAALLAEGFRLVQDGKSLRSVTAWLRRHKVNGKRGEPVSLATVQRMLTDPYCAGATRDHAEKHEPLVSAELFAAVQHKLASRRCRPVKAKFMT